MTGDSVATKLVNNNDATIDMTQGADTLAVAEYQGDGGNFIMDTDLGSETDGDKITIGTKTTAGITYIQVKDASLTNGLGEVTGVKNLLLVTDNSVEQAAQFVGKELNAGSLWDVTPTIENGLAALDANGNPVGTVNEWYLTKVAKKLIMIPVFCWMQATTAMLCGVTATIPCTSVWATCVTAVTRLTATACGPVIPAVSLTAVVLTAIIICTSWAMIKQIMPKVLMVLLWKEAQDVLITVWAAARTSCLRAACMAPGMASTVTIPM